MDSVYWEVKSKTNLDKASVKDIIETLLENRGLKTKEEKDLFFNPVNPLDITLEDVGLLKAQVGKAIKRIEKAIKENQKIIVFGDYDADGVTASAILWECLYACGADALPYIPDRFSEGYAIRKDSVQKLKDQHPNLSLIITVDNGIVANGHIKDVKKMGIDVIITDHHEPSSTLPPAFAIIHSTKTSGSAVSWFFAREVARKLLPDKYKQISQQSLELSAIGTIADQLPLIGINRSIAQFGLAALKITKREGLIQIAKLATIDMQDLNVYHVNFLIAPRINSMGRLTHAMDALRLLCTPNKEKALSLATLVDQTNKERQRILDEVVIHARETLKKGKETVIILADESYHEGVVGLAASRLVEEFHCPAIVFSKGQEFSKASARSIAGFNMIESIRKHSHLYTEGGGHPMAAGFTIETSKLQVFIDEFSAYASTLLTPELLLRKITIDAAISFSSLNWDLLTSLEKFAPFGIGNPQPTFVTIGAKVKKCKVIGSGKHLKLILSHSGREYDAIAFGKAGFFSEELINNSVDVVYNFEKNIWNGSENLQLKVKDIKLHE